MSQPSTHNNIAELGSKITRGFTIAKQWTKQKLGAAEPSKESIEFDGIIAQMKQSHVDLKDLLKRSKALFNTNTRCSQKEAQLQVGLSQLENDSKDEEVKGSLVSLVRASATFQTHQAKINIALLKLVIEPVQQLLNQDFEEALDLKHKYELAHLAHDARVADVDSARNKKAEKREHAEKALQQAALEHEELKLRLAAKWRELEAKVKKLFVENLHQYQQAYEAGFKAQQEQQGASEGGFVVQNI